MLSSFIDLSARYCLMLGTCPKTDVLWFLLPVLTLNSFFVTSFSRSLVLNSTFWWDTYGSLMRSFAYSYFLWLSPDVTGLKPAFESHLDSSLSLGLPLSSFLVSRGSRDTLNRLFMFWFTRSISHFYEILWPLYDVLSMLLNWEPGLIIRIAIPDGEANTAFFFVGTGLSR